MPRAGDGALESATSEASDPLRERGADRSRLDMALATARVSEEARAARSRVPGLTRELFPAATWRRELEALTDGLRKHHADQAAREEARVLHLLAEPRAEEILSAARAQARRLVSTAAAVAKARREQADREATAVITEAEKVAARTLEAAEEQAVEMNRSGEDIADLNDRLTRLRAALRDAETKLGAYSSSTRHAIASGAGVIDLDAEQERGDFGAIIDDRDETAEPSDELEPALVVAEDVTSAKERFAAPEGPVVPPQPAPKLRPKGRFAEPGFYPDRIETLRDEQAP